MTETLKTTIFLVAAVLTVSAAYLLNVTDEKVDLEQYVGQQLTKEIDLDEPRRLSIVKFDKQTGSVRKFEVAEVEGVWSIPSKQDYPADATQQMADAVTCLMGRKILRVEGESAQIHEEFGVVDPLSPKLNSKSVGVGTRVTLSDAEDTPLVDMIVGKAVKGSAGQRYVRLANQNLVYVVELDPTKLSTSFSDWIEDHLLQLSAMDLRKIFINDYSADLSISMTNQGYVPRISLEPRSEITLMRADESADWRVAALKKGDLQAGKIVDDALADDEEVNQEAVKELINGLDDLLIVDIAKKPEGLSADLKAGEAFLNEEEAVSDLVSKGFIPGRQQSGSDMLSSEGELVCSQRNGVEFVLRFGQLQVQTEDDAPGESEEASNEAATTPDGETPAGGDDAKGEAARGENLRRYLFVTARFNEDAVEKPQYKPLPDLPAADAGSENQGEAADTADTAEGGAGAAEETADEARSESGDEAKSGEEAKEGEAEDDEADVESADDKDGEADRSESAGDAEREKIVAERTAIEEENNRLREDYEKLISDGQAEVTRLNARFGDWYYVISNDVFKKIHLTRDQVIKKKEKPAEGAKAPGAASEAAEPEATSGMPDLSGVAAPPAGE
jgi:hypothetical protein